MTAQTASTTSATVATSRAPTSQEMAIIRTKPCAHNSWDNVRIKNGTTTLRCRMCQLQWKTAHQQLPRCGVFLNDPTACHEGCQLVHVHPFKQNLRERVGTHGHGLLKSVPLAVQVKFQQEEERERLSTSSSCSEDGRSNGSHTSTRIVVFIEDDGTTTVEEVETECDDSSL
eukprot:TRINITY_DN240_c3_g3_i2.p1 TRINITY_DN240_c3_g3~~TRINITY_DN240_c3_g3_i2.p1  ORF type:complete len:172 (+),score=35.47 TRINITY_DN240_c3_g3_i2:89-604(+)